VVLSHQEREREKERERDLCFCLYCAASMFIMLVFVEHFFKYI